VCFLSGMAQAQNPRSGAPALSPGPHRVVSTPSRKLSITITHNLPPTRGVVIVPLPPDTVSQRIVSFNLFVGGKERLREVSELDLSPLKKPLRAVRVNQPTGGQAVVRMEVDLFAAALERGLPARPVPPLERAERAALLAAEEYYEYNTPFFRDWMKKHDLMRTPSERDADFAFRILGFLRRYFVYKIPDEKYMQARIAQRKTGEIGFFCAEKSAECWGLSRIYTCALRANGIPCRQVSGFILPDKPKDEPGHHVRVQVHLPSTGWILVEVAGAVTAKDAPLTTFFCCRGDDMVLMCRGVGYQLPGPKTPGRIGTFSGFAFGRVNGDWSYPYGKWKIHDRN
jgi:hypothetical protein